MAQFDLSVVLDYDLVMENHLRFVVAVRKRIADGWQPLGGAFVYEGYLCQAMIKQPEKNLSLNYQFRSLTGYEVEG